jgi:hypothetical protein
MQHNSLWWLAKILQGAGLVVILVGLSLSIGLGLGEEGLASMQMEMQGLALGGALFLAGYLLAQRSGGR